MSNKTRKLDLGRKALFPFRLLLMYGIIMITGLGCSENNEPLDGPTFPVSRISIPSTLDAARDVEISIIGKGFQEGDKIHFASFDDATKEYISTVTSVTEGTGTITLPSGITSGKYIVSVSRGDKSLNCGSLLLNIIVKVDIPDKDGMTVKGVVYSDGIGLSDVVVSDGFEVTVTDEDGIYYLPSKKKNGYVFISVPGNYDVPTDKNLPQFFQRLTPGPTVERKDFSLIKTDNINHVIVTMADWHLANRNNDVQQFNAGFLADVNATIADYKAKGIKVYGLTLGDLSWDAYWYENKYALPEYLLEMYKINCPIFNMIGNHDNDPYIPEDWLSEQPYRKFVGPTYYAFNLGNVHYIVLDNIEYVNTGGAEGVLGDRSYNTAIVSDQMEWLKKHLATIEDKNKPIVIGMHAPLYSRPQVNADGNYSKSYAMGNGATFVAELAGFTNVHVLTGHSHINYAIEGSSSLMEHNTGAVCATWWWTGANGYAGNHICRDGSPGGYGVWEMNNADIKWYYKSVGYERNYQFRAYDLNKVHITAAVHAPNSTDEKLAPYAGEYANSNSQNEVLINVFGYDDKWKVEVKEKGNNLEVKRVNGLDPLHIISYSAKRLDKNATPTASFVTQTTSHLFKVKASSADSPLEIIVTDRFGNTYSETMVRPKAFSQSMR